MSKRDLKCDTALTHASFARAYAQAVKLSREEAEAIQAMNAMASYEQVYKAVRENPIYATAVLKTCWPSGNA